MKKPDLKKTSWNPTALTVNFIGPYFFHILLLTRRRIDGVDNLFENTVHPYHRRKSVVSMAIHGVFSTDFCCHDASRNSHFSVAVCINFCNTIFAKESTEKVVIYFNKKEIMSLCFIKTMHASGGGGYFSARSYGDVPQFWLWVVFGQENPGKEKF